MMEKEVRRKKMTATARERRRKRRKRAVMLERIFVLFFIVAGTQIWIMWLWHRSTS